MKGCGWRGDVEAGAEEQRFWGCQAPYLSNISTHFHKFSHSSWNRAPPFTGLLWQAGALCSESQAHPFRQGERVCVHKMNSQNTSSSYCFSPLLRRESDLSCLTVSQNMLFKAAFITTLTMVQKTLCCERFHFLSLAELCSLIFSSLFRFPGCRHCSLILSNNRKWFSVKCSDKPTVQFLSYIK